MRYLALRLIILQRVVLHVCAVVHLQFAATTQYIHIHHTNQATHNETHCGNAQPEVGTVERNALVGSPSCEGGAEIQSLSGSLTVAHRQQHSAGIEHPRPLPPQEQRYRYQQTRQALQNVGAGRDCTRLHHLHRGGRTLYFLVLQCHSHKAQTQRVVGQYLHRVAVYQRREGTDGLKAQNQQTRQQRRRQQAPPKQTHIAAYKIGNQQRSHNDKHLYQPRPRRHFSK